MQLSLSQDDQGLQEIEASIASRPARRTFVATFILAVIAVLEMGGLSLEDL